MSMYDKLRKHKEIGEFVLDDEDSDLEFISTNVISLNILFSGKIDGGVQKGTINMMSADSSLGFCVNCPLI